MPRYFFHIREGEELILDEEGSEPRNLEAARAHAVVGVRDLLGAAAREGRLPLSHRIEVADESGAVVLTLSFSEVVEIC